MKTDEIQEIKEFQGKKEEDVPHTLRILDEVAKGKPITQRDLSAKLGIALGMTNNYLKRLAHLGYIQIVEGKKRGFHYILTPLGIAKKSVLTYRYIKRSYQIYSGAREKFARFFYELEKGGGRSLVLYKATVVTEIAILALQDSLIDLVAIVDERRAGGKFLGHQIKSLEDLQWLEFDRLLITTEESLEKVAEDLGKYEVPKEKICSLT